MQKVNRQVVVKERPRFLIPTTNCFRMDSGPIPVPAAGQVLIRTLWLGMDPYLFSRIQQVSERSKPIPLGEVMYGATVGRVEISNHPDYAVGDLVSGLWGWQDYAVSDGRGIAKIDKTLSRPSYMLGAMGAAGFGAWLAVAKVLNVQAGETLTFGAALGGMGQIAGQIGKIRGARVVGVAGSREKCRIAIEQLKFDACIDRTSSDFSKELAAALPTGIDAFIVNIGGKMFDAAMPRMRVGGRVAVLGLMENYATPGLPSRPDRTFQLLNEILLKRLQVCGSLVLDQLHTESHAEFLKQMRTWIDEGTVQPIEHVSHGLEKAPEALQGIFAGSNLGKSIVKVAD